MSRGGEEGRGPGQNLLHHGPVSSEGTGQSRIPCHLASSFAEVKDQSLSPCLSVPFCGGVIDQGLRDVPSADL